MIGRFALGFALAAVGAGCTRNENESVALVVAATPNTASPNSGTSPPPAAAQPVASVAQASAPVAATPAGGCRVMSVKGGARWDTGSRVEKRAWVASARWIELDAGAALHLKHAESAREWTLEGPAKFVACPGGNEEIVLAGGTLHSGVGAGVRPGAEVLVGTPFGTLRYADARVELRVAPAELSLSVYAGEAWLSSAAPTGADARVAGSRPLRRNRAERLSAGNARTACGGAAEEAEQQAKALLVASPEPLGARAAAQVRARQRAASVCARAAAAVLQQERGDELGRHLDEVNEFRQQSRRVPRVPG